jgi:hypothetical protein
MNEPIQIKFDCPGCGQSLEAEDAAQFEKMTCPTCQHEFYPVARRSKIVTPAPVPSQTTFPPLPVSKAGAAAKIKAQAESFCGVAIFFVILGVLALLLAIMLSIGVDAQGGYAAWSVMGVCFGAAFWFYLVGQVIHIRANTEK